VARGRFIAFCGGEGAGKSTQIALLRQHLAERGVTTLFTREPGGTPAGLELRKLLLTATAEPWTSMAETLLMIADRAQHVEKLILPALAAGTHVVSDRFVLSTLSYQGAGRGIPTALINDLHRQSCADLWPDLTVVFDIDPALGLARSKKRLSASGSNESRFEDLDLGFHQRVRAGFLGEAKASGKQHVVIDATRAEGEIAGDIALLVDELIGGG
jgi:dTMP kinase